MARPFLDDEAKKALREAAEAVEAASSAELVIAVRPRSGSYLGADLLAGIVAGVASLAFLLFSPWTFALHWFVIDPLVVGLLAGLAASRSSKLRRWLTSRALRRARVERAARATFVERGIHRTRGRTGILLYISTLERDAEVVVDTGVEPLAATAAWQRAVGEIVEGVRRKETGVQLAPRVRALAEIVAPVLVRQVDDVDELTEEIC